MLRHLQQIEANERVVMEFQISKSKPFGIILISANIMCTLCCSNLRLRKDRPASIVIYDKDLGTVHGSHFHKYCVNQACGCITSITRLEDHLQKLFIMMIGLLFNTLFQTAFSLSLLQQTNAEILIS